MLAISAETMSRLEGADLDRFLSDMDAFLRDKVSDLANEPEDRMRAQILALRDRAGKYDIFGSEALAAYIVAAALLGPDFDERFQGAREILTSQKPEMRKADLLGGFTVKMFEALEGKPA